MSCKNLYHTMVTFLFERYFGIFADFRHPVLIPIVMICTAHARMDIFLDSFPKDFVIIILGYLIIS